MRYTILLACILISKFALAQENDTIKTSARLGEATVYYGYGAALHHSARAALRNGIQHVVIDGVAFQPDINTLQLSCPEHVTIMSYQHRIYTSPLLNPTNPRSQLALDSIKTLTKKKRSIDNELSINDDLLRRITGLIETNFVTDDKKQLNGEELVKLTEYYSEKVRQLKNRVFELQNSSEEIQEQISAINARIHAQPSTGGNETKAVGQLILQVASQRAGDAAFELSYFTRSAGWIPAYDLRMATIDNSLKLVYKATVQQTTGLEWKNMKLNLSTSNPNQGNRVPDLSPAFLKFYVPQLYGIMEKDIENQPATLSEVTISKKNTGKPEAYGVSAENVSNYLTLNESQLNINFEIDLPYNIPSDGKPYRINIKEEFIPASFKHYSVPKLDRDAFLVAQVSRWDSLGLLPGEANVIMDNIYIGKSFIDPNTTNDTLHLSMGRDKRISIKRPLVKEMIQASKSDTRTERYTYEINVKNNKKQPVLVTLHDQYPVSTIKELEVKLTGAEGAEVNAETGQLIWNVKLKPAESKTFRFSYSVKYPAGKIIQESR